MTDANQSLATPETLLDEALHTALQDAGQANFFYDTFLNSDFYFPVSKEGTTEGNWSCLGMEDRFHPLFLQYPNGKAMPIFDTLERLKHWAGDKKLDYLVLRCHMLMGMLAPDVAMVLNLATPFHYTLTAEILGKLREVMNPVTPS